MQIAAFACVLLLCSLGTAQATVISGTVTGTIGGSGANDLATDAYGLFGPAGANLDGDPFTLTYAYNTADFAPQQSPCGGCTYYMTGSPVFSESISFAVNGVAQSFGGTTYYDEVAFENAGFGNPYNVFNEEVFTILYGPGVNTGLAVGQVDLYVGSGAPVAFGQPVTIDGAYPGSITFYGSVVHETLDFATAPEPAGLALLGTGLLAGFGLLRGRVRA